MFNIYLDDIINVEVKNLIESLAVETNTKSKVFHRNESDKSNKILRTVVFDTSFTNQRTRTKTISKRKHTSTTNKNSFFRLIQFYHIFHLIKYPILLTVSRMGSIYYCIEDLYMKVFSSLCTLDEFTNLLIKSWYNYF